MSVWSREPPGKTGWYWARIDGSEPLPLHVAGTFHGVPLVTNIEVNRPVAMPGLGLAGNIEWGPRIDPPPWPEEPAQ